MTNCKISQDENEQFLSLKSQLSKYWQEEIKDPRSQQIKTAALFRNIHLNISQKVICLETFDLHKYILSHQSPFEINSNEYPLLYAPIYRDLSAKKCTSEAHEYLKKMYDLTPDFIDSILRPNLFRILNDPDYNYYFWNSTFPNIFGGLVADEYRQFAFNFLMSMKDHNEYFKQGSISFIKHNYNFQFILLNTFFMLFNQSEDEQPNLIDIFKKSLIESIKSLDRYQLDILKILKDQCGAEGINSFKNLVIDSIQYWKYSPLFYSESRLFESAEFQSFIVELNSFDFNFVFGQIDSIKSKLQIPFKLSDAIFAEQDYFYITMLDMIILFLINGNSFELSRGSKIEKQKPITALKKKFILTKGFQYYFVKYTRLQELDYEKVDFPILKDDQLNTKWLEHKQLCNNNQHHPISFIYENNISDMRFAYFCICKTFKEYKESTSVQQILQEKMIKLIPIQKYLLNINELYLINSISFCNNSKDKNQLFKTIENLYSKYFLRTFKCYLKKEQLNPEEKDQEIESQLSLIISKPITNLMKAQKMQEYYFKLSGNERQFSNDKRDVFDNCLSILDVSSLSFVINYYSTNESVNISFDKACQPFKVNTYLYAFFNSNYSCFKYIFNYINSVFLPIIKQYTQNQSIYIGSLLESITTIRSLLKQFKTSENSVTYIPPEIFGFDQVDYYEFVQNIVVFSLRDVQYEGDVLQLISVFYENAIKEFKSFDNSCALLKENIRRMESFYALLTTEPDIE